MSHSEITRPSSFDAPPLGGPVDGTRVDPAHVRGDDAIDIAVVLPAIEAEAGVVALPATVSYQQVQLQAAQLAAHLQRQASSVDHREAELNARLAAMDNQVRAARLWLAEQHEELIERKTELDRREQELIERESALDGASKPIRKKSRSTGSSADDADLAEREAELVRRQAELDMLAARLSEQLAAAHEVEQARQALSHLELRRADLEQAEQLLAAEHAELANERKRLSDQRAESTAQLQAERERADDAAKRASAEHEKTRGELKRQADELAARQAVLEQMRADMSRSQQEVLEIRLATEELWARLCGSMAPAALTQSLAQIRLKLAEEFRLARGELAQQKSEIQALSARLAEQHRKLAHRREDVQAWATQRQRELEQQALRLVDVERRLDEERESMKRKREDWDSQRFSLNQEIRRMLGERARPATAA